MIVTYKGRLGVVRGGKTQLLIEWFGGGKSKVAARKVTFIDQDDIAGFEHNVAYGN